MPARQHPGPIAAAGGAAIAVRPTRGREILKADRLVGKATLELDDVARELRPRHAAKLLAAPDGTG
jgi:hypothetical protein